MARARARRFVPFLQLALVAGLVAVAVPGTPRSAAAGPVEANWLAGDLHVHTYHSHDVCQTPLRQHNGEPCEDPYVWGYSPRGQIVNAEQRGLNFISLTDHNTVEQQSDPGYWSNTVTLVPGYENSLQGHAQMLGARRVYPKGDGGVAAVQAIAAELRADGGLLQINHPMDPTWGYGFAVDVDTVEVWNLPWFGQRDIMGDETVASNNPQAVKYWETWLDRGEHVAATGGSDSHWRSTSSVQGVGEPTTWVFSADRSWQGIIDGIRRGRTIVTAVPPVLKPTMAYLEADADRNGSFEAMVGDTVGQASRFRLRVRRGAGQALRIVTTGGHTLAHKLVEGHDFTYEFTVPGGTTWVRAEVFVYDMARARENACAPVTIPLSDHSPRCLDDHYWMSALTSPIYVG